ncbi:hypothetical protein [Micromonospora sp. WMMD1155]|nr:hypothetical protein [Micromonospora sp. WMMD1155]WFE55332.1 hypothetical protein O7617_24300 [Micromonospora sp. WMMD1155]
MAAAVSSVRVLVGAGRSVVIVMLVPPHRTGRAPLVGANRMSRGR